MINDLVKQAFANNWFKIFTPQNLGGLEFTLPKGIKLLIDSAKINPSLGWVVNLGSGAGYFWAFFTKEASEQLMKSPDFVIAGSGQPNGQAIKTKGGFLISGTWPKCSGAEHATHFTVNAVDEEGIIKSYTLKRQQVDFIYDWTYFGLKETSTYSITCNRAFVPNQYVFTIGKVLQIHHPYKIYKLPFSTFAKYCINASFCGIAEFFLCRVHANSVLCQRIGDNLLKELEAVIAEYYACILNCAQSDWEKCLLEELPEHFKIEQPNGLSDYVEKIYNLACRIFMAGGMRMADTKEPIHQAWCDLLTAMQHSYLK